MPLMLLWVGIVHGEPERSGSWQLREKIGQPVAVPIVFSDRSAADLLDMAPALVARGSRGVICVAGQPFPQAPGSRTALREIREHLASMGLRHVFLRAEPLREDAVDRRALDAFINRTEDLARTARWCGASGLWLDLPVTASLFDPDHPITGEELEKIGRRLYAAIARRFPDADVLVWGGPEGAPGPRWLNFLEGLFEGAGVADSPRVTLVTAVDAPAAGYASVAAATGGVERMVAASFSLENRERWERLGGVSALLKMDAYYRMASQAGAETASGSFRVARDAAVALSDRWVILGLAREANQQQVDPELRLVSPLRGMIRLGALQDDPRAPGQTVQVFERDGRMSLLFPEGLPAPVEISSRYGICASVSLADGVKRYHLSRDGVMRIPPREGPLLVSGLPGQADIIRAGWSWAVDPPLETGPRRVNFMVSWTNRTGLTRQGELAVIPAPRWSLGSASIPFRASPGETVTLRRTLQGIARPGELFSAQLLIQEAGLPPVTRTVAVPVFPKMLWALPLDGACMEGLVLLDGNSLDTMRIIAASRRTGLICFDADGHVIWRDLEPGPWSCGPVEVSSGGKETVALGHHDGHIIFRDARTGNGRGKIMLDGTPVKHLGAFEDGTLLAVTDLGMCYGIRGLEQIWARGLDMSVIRICAGDGRLSFLLSGLSGTRGEAVNLDREGTIRYRVPLPGPATAIQAAGRDGWTVGFADGSWFFLDERGNTRPGYARLTPPLTGLLSLPESAGENGNPVLASGRVVATDGEGIQIMEPGKPPRRIAARPGLARLWMNTEAGVLLAGKDDGTLYAFDETGRLLWQDSRAWGAPQWVIARPAQKGRLALIAAFSDGVVRAWDGGPLPLRK